jgi:hypothetical protein
MAPGVVKELDRGESWQGRTCGKGISAKAIWHIAESAASKAAFTRWRARYEANILPTVTPLA